MNALKEAMEVYRQPIEQFVEKIELIVKGTTLATNALVTRNVVVITKGFRDLCDKVINGSN